MNLKITLIPIHTGNKELGKTSRQMASSRMNYRKQNILKLEIDTWQASQRHLDGLHGTGRNSEALDYSQSVESAGI